MQNERAISEELAALLGVGKDLVLRRGYRRVEVEHDVPTFKKYGYEASLAKEIANVPQTQPLIPYAQALRDVWSLRHQLHAECDQVDELRVVIRALRSRAQIPWLPIAAGAGFVIGMIVTAITIG